MDYPGWYLSWSGYRRAGSYISSETEYLRLRAYGNPPLQDSPSFTSRLRSSLRQNGQVGIGMDSGLFQNGWVNIGTDFQLPRMVFELERNRAGGFLHQLRS